MISGPSPSQGLPLREGRARSDEEKLGEMGTLPFNVILLCLIGLVGRLDVVPLAHNSDVALHVALQPSRDVTRVRQDGPLVVELVLCGGEDWGLHLLPPP